MIKFYDVSQIAKQNQLFLTFLLSIYKTIVLNSCLFWQCDKGPLITHHGSEYYNLIKLYRGKATNDTCKAVELVIAHTICVSPVR